MHYADIDKVIAQAAVLGGRTGKATITLDGKNIKIEDSRLVDGVLTMPLDKAIKSIDSVAKARLVFRHYTKVDSKADWISSHDNTAKRLFKFIQAQRQGV